jgi:hypothetical protein
MEGKRQRDRGKEIEGKRQRGDRGEIEERKTGKVSSRRVEIEPRGI